MIVGLKKCNWWKSLRAIRDVDCAYLQLQPDLQPLTDQDAHFVVRTWNFLFVLFELQYPIFWRFWVDLGWFCRVISNQTKLGDPSLSLPKILYHTATPGILRKGPFMIDRGVRGTRENWPRVLPPLLPLLPCLTDWAVMHMSLSCGNFAQSSIAGLQHIQRNQTRIESKYWKQLRYCPSTNYQRLNTDQGKPYASILPWQPWRTPRHRERQG